MRWKKYAFVKRGISLIVANSTLFKLVEETNAFKVNNKSKDFWFLVKIPHKILIFGKVAEK